MTYLPHIRVSRFAFEDRDNFIRNLVTILGWFPAEAAWYAMCAATLPTSQLSTSALPREPVLALDEIKMHCRIELSQSDEDEYLLLLERGARVHTENVLQRSIDMTVGENVRIAMLLLIAHWYRNREAVSDAPLKMTPAGYDALLWPERAFLTY